MLSMDKSLSGRRILVVEDEILNLAMLDDILTEAGCESVAAAATIDQAIGMIDERRPKLTPRLSVCSAARFGAKRAVGDAGCGDDRSDTARALCSRQIDQRDRSRSATVPQYGSQGPAV
jgi:CheY-like chemotaxis protein